MKQFELFGPLPTGTALLEASAGTGKTYTIATIATRFIGEGAATIDELLLITFGRSATRELRERVRATLSRTLDALRASDTSDDSDPLARHLRGYPGSLERLSEAAQNFDGATIATTHQFCMQSLADLGLAADTDPGEEFVEDITGLIDEVVQDFYVRKYAAHEGPRIEIKTAHQIARAAVLDPQADLRAGPVAPGSIEQDRLRFAQQVRAEVARRRRKRRLVTFDDLVLRLATALTNDETGQLAAQRLRDRYRVVLVDEFQDTDPAQWTILREAFHGHRTLILIGDPKQAIYGFRGADIFSYLDAADHAHTQATLTTNYRSDHAVVEGVAALLGDLELGDPRIKVRPVGAAHTEPRLALPGRERVRLRIWAPELEKLPSVALARSMIAADIAADIAAALQQPVRKSDVAPVQPGDFAVLVRTHSQADIVHEALLAAGIPAVKGSANSVFATEAARHWTTLLEAMERPTQNSIRRAALTDFFGYCALDLARDGDRVDQEVGAKLRDWSNLLEQTSVAALFATISRDTGIAERVLARPRGERELTDLRHIAGLLHTWQRGDRLGLAALLERLVEERREGDEKGAERSRELARRLETDAAAVQVLTVHGSKGLEFPIVYVPFGWDQPASSTPELLQCHVDGRRVLDVRGASAEGRGELLERHKQEDAGEQLRLLYVALTRASMQLVVHWAATGRNTRLGALHRALSAKAAGSTVPAPGYPVKAPPVVTSPWVRVEQVPDEVAQARWEPAARPAPALAAAPFDRVIDPTWRRTSYSGLTAGTHGPETAPPGFRDDEPEQLENVAPDRGPVLASHFAGLPAGTGFGTLVHAVLEELADPADLPAVCAAALARHPVPGVAADRLAGALLPALHTPLGGDLPALAEIPPTDRLAELEFELPLRGGSLARIADLMRPHLPVGEPLSQYPDRLAALDAEALRGYLTGSIDAVLRVGSRYLVVDYKTNLLGAADGEQLVWNYRPSALAGAMMAAHYPLQALLYSVALHRYLRWRLRGYRPEEHLGGVRYLFLRGMAGPATPLEHGVPCGVFAWHPPAELITALSELLDGRP